MEQSVWSPSCLGRPCLGRHWAFAYNTQKGAVTNLTLSLALEFGGQGVRVNAVDLSLTETDMSADLLENTELLAELATASVGTRRAPRTRRPSSPSSPATMRPS